LKALAHHRRELRHLRPRKSPVDLALNMTNSAAALLVVDGGASCDGSQRWHC
jgi:hypothetical protein